MKTILANVGDTRNISSDNTNYAKILETYKHTLSGVTTENGAYAKIKLYVVGNVTYVEKEFLILNPAAQYNPFVVYDLTPKENRIELYYTLEDETYSFYVRATSYTGFFIVCDIEYSDAPGFFKGFHYAKFDTVKDDNVAIEPVIYSKSFSPSFQNDWKNSSSSCKFYQHNKSVYLEITAKSGTITDGTILCSIPSEYAPLNSIYVPVYCWTGNPNEFRENGLCKIDNTGIVTLYHTITNSNLIAIKTTYVI